MHAGSIDNPSCAAGRVYRCLCAHAHTWLTAGDIRRLTGVEAASTRVSEVRLALEAAGTGTVVCRQTGRRWEYRVEWAAQQMELEGVA